MTTPTLDIAYGPTYPVKLPMKPDVLTSTFGDGFAQRSGNGINIFKTPVPVAWASGLTAAEALAVHTQLVGFAGQQNFLWQHPAQSAPTKWVCTDWEIDEIEFDNWSFTGTFVPDYNP